MNDRAARQADITRQLRESAGEAATSDETVLVSWLEGKYSARPDTLLACEHLSEPLREGDFHRVLPSCLQPGIRCTSGNKLTTSPSRKSPACGADTSAVPLVADPDR